MIGRRSFIASLAGLTGALVLPEPPRVRAYSFLPGDRREELLMRAAREAVRKHTAEMIRADIEQGDFVTVDENGELRRATPGDTLMGVAYLVTQQTDPAQNGVYVVRAGQWWRP